MTVLFYTIPIHGCPKLHRGLHIPSLTMKKSTRTINIRGLTLSTHITYDLNQESLKSNHWPLLTMYHHLPLPHPIKIRGRRMYTNANHGWWSATHSQKDETIGMIIPKFIVTPNHRCRNQQVFINLVGFFTFPHLLRDCYNGQQKQNNKDWNQQPNRIFNHY